MKILFIIIKEELFKIKNQILAVTIFNIITPLILYLSFSIPLSAVFTNLKPIYLSWSSAGIYITSTVFIIFYLTSKIFKENLESEFIYTLPIKLIKKVIANYLFLIFLGIIHILIAIILITTLNNEYIRFLDILFIILNMIPILIIIISLAIIFTVMFENQLYNFYINFILFIFLSFGLGSFIPLKYFPVNYIQLIQYFPIAGTILNVQKIISAESIFFSLFVISIIYSIIVFGISIALLNNKIKQRSY